MNYSQTQNQRSVISFIYLKSSKVHSRNNKQKEYKTTENTRKQQNTRKTTKIQQKHRKITENTRKTTKDNKKHVYKREFHTKRIQKITENNRK